MQKKLLIIGGSGFIGGNIKKVAEKQGWNIYIAGRMNKLRLESTIWRDIDITDEKSIRSVIKLVNPDVVINGAAIADIDKAEEFMETAWKVNVEGAKFAAKVCSEFGIKYIFISSDAVFDGQGRYYNEDDIVKPVNYYGYTKSEAEKAVLSSDPLAIVIRISLVLGYSVSDGNTFLTWLEERLKEGNKVFCPSEEVRTPVDVITLSECIMELAESSYTGIIHIGSTDCVDRLNLTKKLAGAMGYNVDLIYPQPDGIIRRVPRHKNGSISIEIAKKILKTPLLSVDEGINRILQKRNN